LPRLQARGSLRHAACPPSRHRTPEAEYHSPPDAPRPEAGLDGGTGRQPGPHPLVPPTGC